MTIEHINPPGLWPPEAMTHVVAASGGRTLYLSGQGPYNADQQLIGPGDHQAQFEQAFRNVVVALAGAGATWRDVVKVVYFVVGVTPEVLEGFGAAMYGVLGEDAEPAPAATFVGVASLAYPEMLVEIDVIAVVD